MASVTWRAISARPWPKRKHSDEIAVSMVRRLAQEAWPELFADRSQNALLMEVATAALRNADPEIPGQGLTLLRFCA